METAELGNTYIITTAQSANKDQGFNSLATVRLTSHPTGLVTRVSQKSSTFMNFPSGVSSSFRHDGNKELEWK